MKLETLSDVFKDAMTARGPQYAKQLLYTLLTPRVSTNEMSILNYDNKFWWYLFKLPMLNCCVHIDIYVYVVFL